MEISKRNNSWQLALVNPRFEYEFVFVQNVKHDLDTEETGYMISISHSDLH